VVIVILANVYALIIRYHVIHDVIKAIQILIALENMNLNYLNHKLQLVRQLIRKAFLKTTVKVVKNKKNYYYYLIN
jgi:hypothetical protein